LHAASSLPSPTWRESFADISTPTRQMPDRFGGSIPTLPAASAVTNSLRQATSSQEYENAGHSNYNAPGGYKTWILWCSTSAQISVPIAEDFGLTVYRDGQNSVNTLPAELSVDQMPVLLENHDL
jgi:hypothetical protein